MDLETILDNFEFLDDWEDKYRYVIELGRTMPELSLIHISEPTDRTRSRMPSSA